MAQRLQIALCVAVILVIGWLIRYVKKGKCNLRFVLPWFVVMGVLLLLVIQPGIAAWMASVVGIAVPSNLLLFMGLGVCLLLIFHLTVTLSNMNDRQRRLTQEIALLRKELQDKGGAGQETEEAR